MQMLAAHLNMRIREESCREYTAQMLWYLTGAVYKGFGGKFDYPSWAQMVNPNPDDDRSGMEIVEEIKEKMRERKRKRERRE